MINDKRLQPKVLTSFATLTLLTQTLAVSPSEISGPSRASIMESMNWFWPLHSEGHGEMLCQQVTGHSKTQQGLMTLLDDPQTFAQTLTHRL